MKRSYIFKLLHSPYLYGTMTVILGFSLIMMNAQLGGRQGLMGQDVHTDIELLLQSDGYRKHFVVLGAIPFAANFADEWSSKTIINCVTRKSAVVYSVSNVIACFFSTLMTVFVPLVIFAAIDSFRKEVYFEINGPAVSYGGLQAMGLPFLSVVMVIFTYALSCAMWSVAGMTLSVFFPSKYIAIGSPFVLCYVFEELTYNAPMLLNFTALSNARTYIPDGLTFLYTIFVFGGLSAVCGALFTMKVGKRVRNELG